MVRACVLVVVSVFVALAFAERSEAYTTCGDQPHAQSDFPIQVWVDPSGFNSNLSYAELSAAVDRAWQAWVDLPDSNISFVRVSSPPSYPGHRIEFIPNLANPEPYTAETYCNDPYWAQTGFPQVTNVRSTFAMWDTNPVDGVAPDRRSLDDVLLHEVGHFLGLHHSCTPDGSAIMCATNPVTNNLGVLRTIGPDAQAAMAAFYPNSGVPTPTATPSLTPTPIVVVSCERKATYSNGQVVVTALPLGQCP